MRNTECLESCEEKKKKSRAGDGSEKKQGPDHVKPFGSIHVFILSEMGDLGRVWSREVK